LNFRPLSAPQWLIRLGPAEAGWREFRLNASKFNERGFVFVCFKLAQVFYGFLNELPISAYFIAPMLFEITLCNLPVLN
jgi:hypothetical protein